MSDAYSNFDQRWSAAPGQPPGWLPQMNQAPPGGAPAPASPGGFPQAPQISATNPALGPQRVKPTLVPANQVPSNPIMGNNPFRMGPTPQPNNGMRPGQGNPQNNPISSIVSGIVSLPANVARGVMQGLQAYTNPQGWTNTPQQVSNMSTNVANGQPPAGPPGGGGQPGGGGMTPPPGGGGPSSWAGPQPGYPSGSWGGWNANGN